MAKQGIEIGEPCACYFDNGILGAVFMGVEIYVGKRRVMRKLTKYQVPGRYSYMVPTKYIYRYTALSNLSNNAKPNEFFKPEYKHLSIEDFRPSNLEDVMGENSAEVLNWLSENKVNNN